MNTSFLGFMIEKLSKPPDDESLIKHLYMNNMLLFGYDLRDKEKQWAEKAAARERHLVSRVQKTFDETEEQGSDIQGRASAVPIV